MTSRVDRRPARPSRAGRARLVWHGLSSFYLWILLTLACWALVPFLFGLQPLAINSGSMRPAINPGDVVVVAPEAAHPVPAGTVVTYHDPAEGDRLVTHRVVDHLDDGTYETKGDANDTADSTSLPPSNVVGRPRLLVPVLGQPAVWLRSGHYLWFGLSVLGSVLAVLGLAQHPPERPRSPRSPTRPRVRRRRIPAMVAAVVMGFTLGLPGTVNAAWAATVSTDGAWDADALEVPANADGSVTCDVLSKDIQITWDAVPSDSSADGYSVYRSTSSGGPYEWRGDVDGAGSTQFDDQGLEKDGADYYYVVRSAIVSTSWESANSNEAHVPACG